MGRRAAIYARISQDRGEEIRGLGVARQEADCRTFIANRGWSVAGVFIDNDVSAYSTARRQKIRPAYAQLLEAIGGGAIDVLVVWHPDRLHRSPIELEDFILLVEASASMWSR